MDYCKKEARFINTKIKTGELLPFYPNEYRSGISGSTLLALSVLFEQF